MRAILLVLCFCGMLPLFANDGYGIGEGGTFHFLHGEHASIRMVSEHVVIKVYEDYYDVDATFIFHNDGKACSVQMGFPESGGGADVEITRLRTYTAFTRFTTWVDGSVVPVTREKAKTGEEYYRAFWVKTVDFAAGQTRTVRVQYRSVAGNVSMGSRSVSYNFTGGNWKGLVKQSDLDVYVLLPETSFVNAPASAQETKQPNHFHYTWKRWQAVKTFNLNYVSTWPEWLTVSDDDYRPFPISRSACIVTNPGRVKALDWTPNGVMRGETAYIALEALYYYLQNHAATPHTDKGISQQWDPVAGKGELRVHGVTLRFILHSAEMAVMENGATVNVTMPAPVFLSRPGYSGGAPGQLFVPAATVLSMLGGRVAVDLKVHRMTLTLPKPAPQP